jgi:hypothetical protein
VALQLKQLRHEAGHNVVPKLRISGATSPLPQCAFMPCTWIGTFSSHHHEYLTQGWQTVLQNKAALHNGLHKHTALFLESQVHIQLELKNCKLVNIKSAMVISTISA